MQHSADRQGELSKSSIAIRGAMIDEVKAVDTKGVDLKPLDTCLKQSLCPGHQAILGKFARKWVSSL